MADQLGNDTLTFLNDFVDLDVSQYASIGITIQGTFTATVTWTASIDGVNYFAIFPINGASANTTGATTQFFNVNGLARLRFTATAYTSGTIAITWVSQESSANLPSPTQSSATGVVAGTAANSLGKAEDAAHTSGDTGVAVWGVRNDSRATSTNTDGDYTAIAMHPTGAVYTQNLVSASNLSTNAPSQHRVASAASTNATSVKGSAGVVYSIVVTNTNAAIRYVKFFNSASAPTPGSGTPVLVVGVGPTQTTQLDFSNVPMTFGTGIGYDIVTGAADTDATAVAANDILMTVLYI